MAEWLIVTIGFIELAANVLIVLWVRSIDSKTEANKSQAARIDALEDAMQRKTEQIVDARFAANTATFKADIVRLTTLMEGVIARLEKGDRQFREDEQARHELELNVITKIAEKCVSKAEFEKFEHRFEARMHSFDNSVTRFISSARPRSDP